MTPEGQILISRRLLRGATAVCMDCHREIGKNEARIVVDGKYSRCGDCEYRQQHPEEE